MAVSLSNIFYYGNDEVKCAYTAGILNQYENNIVCDKPLKGQYVQIQINETEYLHMYEVDVYGVKS